MVTLAQRFSSHKTPTNSSTSKQIIEKGDAVILLVEDYPCESEDEANARESFYILNNPCVNKNIPGQTKIERDKRYYTSNKTQINEQCKQYYESKKEEISKKKKEYYLKKKSEKNNI